MKGENEVQESTRKMLRNGAIRDHAVTDRTPASTRPYPDGWHCQTSKSRTVSNRCPCPLTHPVQAIRLSRANEQGEYAGWCNHARRQANERRKRDPGEYVGDAVERSYP
jgi:hypothetical protein